MAEAGELDLPALVDGLIGVLERGDSHSTQAAVPFWLDALGVGPEHLLPFAGRLIPLVTQMPSTAAARLLEAYLDAELEPDLIDELATAVLLRKEKGLRKRVLAALRDRPASPTVLPIVQELAQGSDVALAKAATEMLAVWGIAVEHEHEHAGPLGLWRAVAPPARAPLEWPEADSAALIELCRQMGPYHDFSAISHERWLALLVELAARDGAGPVKEQLGGLVNGNINTLPVTFRIAHADAEAARHGHRPDLASMAGLPHAARVSEVHASLGEIPVLLSTPTSGDMSLDWPTFTARLARYASDGVAARPVDLAVALYRIDRRLVSADGIAGLAEAPIEGAQQTVAEVVAAWREGSHEARLRKTAPVRSYVDAPDVRVDVEVPDLVASLPGTEALWQGVEPKRVFYLTAEPARTCLLPWLTGAEAGRCWLLDSETEAVRMAGELLRIAGHVDQPLRYALLMRLNVSSARNRDDLAAYAAEAYLAGRLIPDEAVATLRGEDGPGVLEDAALGKLAAGCGAMAEAGGLGLAWPLLAALLTHTAAQPKLPSGAVAVVETMLRLAPEVRRAVDEGLAMPSALDIDGLAGLAARRGASKAVTTARALQAALA